MRDRKQIREAIEGVTAETGGWDAPPTWSQIADVLAALLSPAQAGGEAADFTDAEIDEAVAYANEVTRFGVGRDDRECARRALAGDTAITRDWAEAVRAKAAEIRARRKPAPSPGPARSGACSAHREDGHLDCAACYAPAPGPGDAAPAFKPCGKPACGACTDTGGTMGELATDIMANHAAEIAPDALRERAIRAMAEAGGVPESVVRAAAGEEGIVKREVDAVERALRDEYEHGLADASAVVLDRLAAPREEPAPAGVLALVEGHVIRRADLGCHVALVGRMDVDPDRVNPGQRVTVAVLTGSLAGIVKRDRAWQEWREHVQESATRPCLDCGCGFDEDGNPAPDDKCEDGQRLAAAVNGVGGAK